jgi:hypothetical protein
MADEPPFFISQKLQSGSFNPVEHGAPDLNHFGGSNQQDSEKEDLRDVIDDLTIENKRLKQLLKKRKSQQDLQDRDKLFEVRVHGLPSNKKRELEVLLRNFASNLNANSGLPSGLLSRPPAAEKPNFDARINGAATKHIQTDSGYTSNSNSGQTSAALSNPGRPNTAVSRKSNEKTVKSYLHNIPNGLLPRRPPVMSEAAKMSLVVRRLENLFTGKTAAPGDHSLPMQQQEVSRLAANADMQCATKHYRQEGSREAHMLPFNSEVNIERLDSLESSSSDSISRLTTRSEASRTSTPEGINSAWSADRSPNQRPTRPLDLDIHRAQIAEENIEYLRHLGLTSPKLNAEANKEDGEGWIYLNLLMSMAQLHTINVTAAFIRKSIKKLSAKFELSDDGNQVRWKGEKEATDLPPRTVQTLDMVDRNSANEIVGRGADNADKQSDRMTTSNTQTSATPSEDKWSNQMNSQLSKRPQLVSSTQDLHISGPTSRSQPVSSFDYKPIRFTEKSLSRPSFSYLDESTGSQLRFDDSSPTNSNDTLHGITDQTDTGPIVFYNSTLFCSDFSGDRAPTNMRRPNPETWRCCLGMSAVVDLDETRDGDVSYFAKSTVTPIPESSVGALVFHLPPIIDSCNSEQKVRELPASGIGGVTPQDNFLLDVKIARSPSAALEGKEVGLGKRVQQIFEDRIAACWKTDLPPSQLPPPSYIFRPYLSGSSSGVEGAWDSEDEGGDTSIDEHEPVPPYFLTHVSTEESSPNDSDEDMDTDSSVDMLATARVICPSMLSAQGREFEMNSKPRPMEAVVTGSLAATAGDGSETDSGAESDVDEVDSYTDSDDDL